MKLEIKGYKRVRGHDGQGFNATLYVDGKKAAFVDDDGWGGGYQYQWFDQDARLAFAAHVASLPPEKSEYFPEGLKPDADIVIGDLIDRVEDEKEHKRMVKLCATACLFTIKGQRAGAYYVTKVPYNDVSRASILKRHPDAEFINDHLADGKWKVMVGLEKPSPTAK